MVNSATFISYVLNTHSFAILLVEVNMNKIHYFRNKTKLVGLDINRWSKLNHHRSVCFHNLEVGGWKYEFEEKLAPQKFQPLLLCLVT